MLHQRLIRNSPYPIAIGAVGGSGTRIIAQLLSASGYYMGSDLNEAHDNLWFTLLFKRRDVLVEPLPKFRNLAEAFFARMQGRSCRLDGSTIESIRALGRKRRLQHPAAWLQERVNSFLDNSGKETQRCWGWKEPNTHIVIDRLLELHARLRYIHVVRNGLDMAYSKNLNQLEFWGPIFLGHHVELTPSSALAYWCAVDRRISDLTELFPHRIKIVDYDSFCANPVESCRDILSFCSRRASDRLIENFASQVRAPETVGRSQQHSIADLHPIDVEYAKSRRYNHA